MKCREESDLETIFLVLSRFRSLFLRKGKSKNCSNKVAGHLHPRPRPRRGREDEET